jgi:FtsP/CotA-like multicopper oxidase with cupredoxin domain
MEEFQSRAEKGARLDRRSFLKVSGGVLGGGLASMLLGKSPLPQVALGTTPVHAGPIGGLLNKAGSAAPATTRHFYIYATDGYLVLPDGNKTYIRGFAGNNPPTTPVSDPASLVGHAQLPAPIIDCIEGDDCFLHLEEIGNANRRAPEDPHTIHLHGLHVSTQNDGFPETSFELMHEGATYYFKPEHPGTFMWHCHVEASEHVQMGMYGALIVRPRTNSYDTVYGGIEIDGQVVDRFDKEYVMLLSDLDTRWHRNIEVGNNNFNPIEFRPDYWLLNGRAFPDTTLPAQSVFTGNQGGPPPGYDSYVHVRTGQRFLLRMINMGYDTVPWHVHGWHFVIVGKDASPLLIRTPHGTLHEEYTVTIGSGETYDLIIEATDKSELYANRSPQGVDYVTIPRADGGTHRYDGTAATFFPQFYPMHNHDDYKVTNNGIYPGGAVALIQADAP